MIYVMFFPRKRFFADVALEWRISSMPKINNKYLKSLEQTKPSEFRKKKTIFLLSNMILHMFTPCKTLSTVLASKNSKQVD